MKNRTPTRLKVKPLPLFVILLSLYFNSACQPGETAQPPQNQGNQSVRVVTETAREQNIAEDIRLVGTLSANESVSIASEIAGIVENIHFEEGDTVKRDHLLLKLNTNKLEAQIAETKAEYDLAKANYERGKSLIKENVISVEEFDQRESSFRNLEGLLENRREQLEDAFIRAPFEGVLGERMVSPGQYINAGQTLTRLVDLAPIKAEFKVPERFIGQLEMDQSVAITVSPYPNKTFRGKVYFISPEVDESTRTILVKARIPNEDTLLKPGMFANLELTLDVRRGAVVIPESAVFLQGDQKFVYVFQEDGTAGLRPVTTGRRLPGRVEIISGIESGERVIAEGHPQKLFPGVAVTEAESEEFESPDVSDVTSSAFEEG